jgi:putative zinc finger/helix-turn-helix YgiT family protein
MTKTARSTSETCISCGSDHVTVRDERDRFFYGTGSDRVELEVPVRVIRCVACGSEFTADDTEDVRHAAVCKHLGLLTPEEIRAIREQYGLTRVQFARVTRLGEATLARWERAELLQSAAYDRYLRLVAVPENFERLQVKVEVSCATEQVAATSERHNRYRALTPTPDKEREQQAFQLRVM